ncbi:MAG: HAMP domain-containing histidine kinase [Bacteroides sp.]|nr:HAMP domain-containing histidine kinase [Bacteroides sp.]MCM1379649.1 HAMP domain-containing histidine kinase [Bacteroides sp.]MCM1445969.1 HAMP domain-containing histidine kinase [Prevotella sp.]
MAASLILSCNFIGKADQYTQPDLIADSLRTELANVTDPADSLRLLLNIFDLTPNISPVLQVRRIYFLAKKVGDLNLQFDMLRQWISLGLKWGDRGITAEGMKELKAMPDCEDKRQTEVFINIDLAALHSYKSDAERLNYLRQVLRECADMSDNTDPYERVTKHFILMVLLKQETHGDLLSKYTLRLGKAMDVLPPIYHSYLRSRYNHVASTFFWENDELLNGVKCDRNLLLQLRRLEKFHRDEQGRMYKNYDMHKYNALRRILRNYEILSEKEIRDYNQQILDLVAADPQVAEAYNRDYSSHVAIMDITGRYKEAIPKLQQLVEQADGAYELRMYLRWLVKFADFAGNEPVKIDAERRLSELLDTYINQTKRDERSRELKLLYEVNDLRRLAAARQLEREQKKTYLLYGFGAVILALLVTFIFLYGVATRRRRKYEHHIHDLEEKKHKLTKRYNELETRHSALRKSESERTQMLSYLSHEITTPLSAIINYSKLIAENTAGDTRDYIRRFASIVEVNSEILQEVAKDITEIEINEEKKVPITHIPTNINALAEVSIESVKPQLKQGVNVELIPDADHEDATANLDPRRVQIVLLSCLNNMAQLIEQGTLTLSASLDGDVCTFAITSLGKEISEEKAKKVFAAWADFDDDAKVEGLGVPNCQLILNAIHATLTLDRSCTNGSRLLFKIPVE